MKIIAGCIVGSWLAIAGMHAQQIKGIVTDARIGQGLAGVNIVIDGSNRGSTTGRDGRFTLTLVADTCWLVFSHVGYSDVRLRAFREMGELEVQLHSISIPLSDEVVIYGDRRIECGCEKRSEINSLVTQVEGVDLTTRANFASEPIIRGLGSSAVSTTIDGMKIFGACIDHMDPVNAYVETENLRSLEISKGGFDLSHAATLGGSVNLVTHKPEFEKAVRGEAELGYETVSNLRRGRAMINMAKGDWAWRGTLSAKKSGDLIAGGNRRVQSSGFAKSNFKLDVSRRIHEHTVTTSLIGDNAWDIGYPSMLMDARKTESYILSVEDDWRNPPAGFERATTRTYFNSIRHWMDDYDRDVVNRPVMRGMYMPMYGTTSTGGVLSQWVRSDGRKVTTYSLDYHHVQAFADMDMRSVDPEQAPMHVINIGDVHVDRLSMETNQTRMLSESWTWRWSGRLDMSKSGLASRDGKRVLEGALGHGISDQIDVGLNASMVLRKAMGDNEAMTLKLARNQRLPTYLEYYGFYLYNLMDGYFYTGNPALDPETGYQVELGGEGKSGNVHWNVGVHHTYVVDMILGVRQSEEFKMYDNVASARLSGAEAHLEWSWKRCNAWGTASYTHGRNVSLNEPLPQIPPFKTHVSVSYGTEPWSVQGEWLKAFSQRRTASRSTLEDRTPGYDVIHARMVWEVRRNLTCKVGVENVFDVSYHEHTSVNNFPAPGRNVYLALTFTY